MCVTPLAGVWIEIWHHAPYPQRTRVTPLAGVWIEIILMIFIDTLLCVTPLAGVWIEITEYGGKMSADEVTPLAGVWIEIERIDTSGFGLAESLPLRECGLKFGMKPKKN